MKAKFAEAPRVQSLNFPALACSFQQHVSLFNCSERAPERVDNASVLYNCLRLDFATGITSKRNNDNRKLDSSKLCEFCIKSCVKFRTPKSSS